MAIADAQQKGESNRAIEDLELGIKADPSDVQLKIRLAETILRLYLTDYSNDDDLDAERLRKLVKEIPEPDAPFSRACLLREKE